MARSESAKDAYDSFAAVYDEHTSENDYELWLGETILPELEGLGLEEEGWALDVGCGTGRAFEPLLDRGWRVTGCDVSSGMLEEARGKFGTRVELFEADAIGLPRIGPEQGHPSGADFDLVLMLNDVLNYVTEEDDLRAVFTGIEPNLSPRGLVAFDVNTLSLFRRDFARDAVKDREWEWRGLSTEFGPGLVYESRLSGRGVEPRVHRQRHWPPERIEAALAAAGLRRRAAFGQREEVDRILLSEPPDEERDVKIVYVASL